MERAEYDKLDEAEDRMWWFAAMHRNLLMLADQRKVRTADLPLLDAGCGTGGFLALLTRTYRDKALFGLEFDHYACVLAAAKSSRPVCAGSVNDLPFSDCSLAQIFSADVLCHRGVDECRALREFYRCLAEGGWLILNLPAYDWMISSHDAAVHNVRRYTATRVCNLLRSIGFRPLYVSYWNSVLFPLMVITRKVFRRGRGTGSDVKYYPPLVDVLCRGATCLETALLRRGVKMPFGGSVVAIAVKGNASND
ncbi:MAG: class I SAM-dependent methyltransferase [Acetobacteraceae bacterium]|nr:class I SAM-dependent methyltransferase [Acetobacteraceae bacterium]